MGEALLITSGKGGVGKTTTTANLAAALALMDRRVALIDADTGLRGLDVLLGVENTAVYDLSDAAEGVCRLKQALVSCPHVRGLDLLPAAMLREVDSVTEAQMKDISERLRQDYDCVIIDSPPGLDRGFRIAAAGADRALIVAEDSAVGVRAAERTRDLLRSLGMENLALLVNRARPERLRRGDTPACERIAARLELPLAGVVEELPLFSEAAQHGRPAVLENEELGDVFAGVARRLRGETLPVRPPREKGFWGRLLNG